MYFRKIRLTTRWSGPGTLRQMQEKIEIEALVEGFE